MSSATVTPSLVTLGLPQPLSSTALRPRGPRVERTARASLLTPANSFCRASSLYVSCVAHIQTSPFDDSGSHALRLPPGGPRGIDPAPPHLPGKSHAGEPGSTSFQGISSR